MRRISSVLPETDAIAFAVVTRDRPELLARCLLPALREAAAVGYEVVVVDQSEGSATTELVGAIAGVRYVRSEPGLSRGRNVAIAETTAPLIAFTDDDVTVPDGWLAGLATTFEGAPDAGAVCGKATTPAGELLPGKPAGVYRWPSHPFRLGSGFNLGLRREALADAGAFDEQLGAGSEFCSAEDTDLLYRIMRAGWSVVCTDDVTVVHHDWRTPAEERRLHYRYGFGAGAQSAKHVKAGDRAAAAVALREAAHHVAILVRSGAAGRRQRAALQLAFLHGLFRGFWLRLRAA